MLSATEDRLSALRAKSRRRRELLARELGAASASELPALLGACPFASRCSVELSRPPLFGSVPNASALDNMQAGGRWARTAQTPRRPRLARTALLLGAPAASRPMTRWSRASTRRLASVAFAQRPAPCYKCTVCAQAAAEPAASVYSGSAAFLKGTQSANPHNDYSQHYVDTGGNPANFIRDPSIEHRFAEYPRLNELIRLKDELVAETATPPMYLQCDVGELHARQLGTRFDAIVIEPPLEEYFGHGNGNSPAWSWERIASLDIGSLSEARAFVWLWCGSSPRGTEEGRRCLRRWGFRRCEDVCWVKTNAMGLRGRAHVEPNAVFHRVKEHCLMGIKGTVRRSVDGDFIHANVDMDLIIAEERPAGDRSKPEEIFLLAEHFCLGRRRLHLFGSDHTLRPGWVTVGTALTSSNFDAKLYRSYFERRPGLTTGCTERIEALRPKSPQRGGPKANVQRAKVHKPAVDRRGPAFAAANAFLPGMQLARRLNFGRAAQVAGAMRGAPHTARPPQPSASRIVSKHKRWAIAVQQQQQQHRFAPAAAAVGKRRRRL